MTKLTDTQLVILSKAAQRDDRAVAPSGSGAAKALVALVERGLLAETAWQEAMPLYRRDDDDGPRALVISDLGLVAIGVSAEPEATGATPENARQEQASAESATTAPEPAAMPAAPIGKTALVVNLLEREEGASIAALTEATGWLPHSTRAVLTGLRKKGYAIERGKNADQVTVYKIARAARQAA